MMERPRDGSLAFTVLVSAGAAALAAVASVALLNSLQDRSRDRRDRDHYGSFDRLISPGGPRSKVSFSGDADGTPRGLGILRRNSIRQEATVKALQTPFEDDEIEEDPVAFLNSTGGGGRSRANNNRRREEALRAKEEIIGAISDSTVQKRNTGFSMEDALHHAQSEKEKAMQMKPRDVVSELQKGNTRFWMGVANRPEMSAFERRALIMNQYPQVAVLGCADSRVPVEIVFDQGLGDLFVVRVAGSYLDNGASASIQYAVVHLNVKVVLVMGHEGCGAVKAAMLPKEQLAQEPEELREMLLSIKGGLDEERLKHVLDKRAHDREAVVTNVNQTLKELQKDEAIMERVRRKELILVGAFYEISSGIVDIVKEVDS